MTATVLEKKAGTASKWATWLLLLAGVSVPAAIRWFEPDATFSVPRWACWCVPLAVVVAWILSRSWLRTSGATIAMSDLRFDSRQSFYVITLTNTGRKRAKPRTMLLTCEEIEGSRSKLIPHSMMIWEGDRQEMNTHGEHVDIRILADVVNEQQDHALGAFVMRDKTNATLLVPYGRQAHRKALRIEISADCGDKIDGNQEEKAFILRPREGTWEYAIERERRWF